MRERYLIEGQLIEYGTDILEPYRHLAEKIGAIPNQEAERRESGQRHCSYKLDIMVHDSTSLDDFIEALRESLAYAEGFREEMKVFREQYRDCRIDEGQATSMKDKLIDTEEVPFGRS